MVRKISGKWYNDYAYYRFKVFTKPAVLRQILRILLTPCSWLNGIYRDCTGKFIISRVELVLTTRCTLRCKDCSNLIQYYQHPEDIDAEILIQDLQTLLLSVDRIECLVLLGGEPLLHKEFEKIMQYGLTEPKIGTIHLISNGTIVPKSSTITLLKHPKVYVSISGYPEKVAPKRNKIMALLAADDISVLAFPNDWQDLGGLHHQCESDKRHLRARFYFCFRKKCHTLFDGQYHICARSAHGSRLGQFLILDKEYVQIRGCKDRTIVRKELRDLLRLPYLTACGHCNGTKGEFILPALQYTSKEEYEKL